MVGGYHKQKPSKSAGHEKKQKACRTCFETPPPIGEEKYAGVRCPSFNYPKKRVGLGLYIFTIN
jgi:hypothetical protein